VDRDWSAENKMALAWLVAVFVTAAGFTIAPLLSRL
jgi:hypothetical protein